MTERIDSGPILEATATDLQELATIARDIYHNHLLSARLTILLIDGEMGAGKTTFVSLLGRAMGIEQNINSPTFNLLNRYVSADGEALYHYDLYRLSDSSEVLDMGFAESWSQLDSGEKRALHAIEWWRHAEDLFENGPDNKIYIGIKTDMNIENGPRNIKVYR